MTAGAAYDLKLGKPGGSIAPGYRDVGADNYSVRWTGQVAPLPGVPAG